MSNKKKPRKPRMIAQSSYIQVVDAEALFQYMRENSLYKAPLYALQNHTRTFEIPPRLIRCKDCKWYVRSRYQKDGVTIDMRIAPDCCDLTRVLHAPDWYCADAEEKAEEEVQDDE